MSENTPHVQLPNRPKLRIPKLPEVEIWKVKTVENDSRYYFQPSAASTPLKSMVPSDNGIPMFKRPIKSLKISPTLTSRDGENSITPPKKENIKPQVESFYEVDNELVEKLASVEVKLEVEDKPLFFTSDENDNQLNLPVKSAALALSRRERTKADNVHLQSEISKKRKRTSDVAGNKSLQVLSKTNKPNRAEGKKDELIIDKKNGISKSLSRELPAIKVKEEAGSKGQSTDDAIHLCLESEIFKKEGQTTKRKFLSNTFRTKSNTGPKMIPANSSQSGVDPRKAQGNSKISTVLISRTFPKELTVTKIGSGPELNSSGLSGIPCKHFKQDYYEGIPERVVPKSSPRDESVAWKKSSRYSVTKGHQKNTIDTEPEIMNIFKNGIPSSLEVSKVTHKQKIGEIEGSLQDVISRNEKQESDLRIFRLEKRATEQEGKGTGAEVHSGKTKPDNTVCLESDNLLEVLDNQSQKGPKLMSVPTEQSRRKAQKISENNVIVTTAFSRPSSGVLTGINFETWCGRSSGISCECLKQDFQEDNPERLVPEVVQQAKLKDTKNNQIPQSIELTEEYQKNIVRDTEKEFINQFKSDLPGSSNVNPKQGEKVEEVIGDAIDNSSLEGRDLIYIDVKNVSSLSVYCNEKTAAEQEVDSSDLEKMKRNECSGTSRVMFTEKLRVGNTSCGLFKIRPNFRLFLRSDSNQVLIGRSGKGTVYLKCGAKELTDEEFLFIPHGEKVTIYNCSEEELSFSCVKFPD